MGSRILALAASAALFAGCAASDVRSPEDLQRQVADTERAFAKTMADRDHAAFTSFVSEEAVFFSGEKALRGKRAVSAAWAPLYAKPQAPFSWEPDQVQVLDSGSLALSTGPVHDPHGKLIARFTSIWRQEAPGVWRIVFDKGSLVCDCESALDSGLLRPSSAGSIAAFLPRYVGQIAECGYDSAPLAIDARVHEVE